MVKCNPCLRAWSNLINPKLVTQEDPDAELKRWKMKAKSRAAKEKEDQVHSGLLAMDAT